MKRRRFGLLLLGTLILASAAPAEKPLDLVRAGNAAFQVEDYEKALDLYTRAEELITDPGMVALNKAAAYYRIGQYHPAEVHYVRALEDAQGPRRARLYYDLANAVLKQAEARGDLKQFDRAIRFYQDCLRDEASSDSLREDAKHNLKVAQLLRAAAKPGKDPGKPKDPDDEKNPPPDDDKRPGQRNTGGAEEPGAREDPRGKMQQVGEKERGKEAKVSRRPTPGTGNLPPISDEEELKRMPPEEAAAHLREAAARILAERKDRRKPVSGNPRNVLNW